MCRGSVRRDKGWEHCSTDKHSHPLGSQSPVKPKQEKLKETHALTHHTETAEYQRQKADLKCSQKENTEGFQQKNRPRTDWLLISTNGLGEWNDHSMCWEKNKCQPRILYPLKLHFKNKVKYKHFKPTKN